VFQMGSRKEVPWGGHTIVPPRWNHKWVPEDGSFNWVPQGGSPSGVLQGGPQRGPTMGFPQLVFTKVFPQRGPHIMFPKGVRTMGINQGLPPMCAPMCCPQTRSPKVHKGVPIVVPSSWFSKWRPQFWSTCGPQTGSSKGVPKWGSSKRPRMGSHKVGPTSVSWKWLPTCCFPQVFNMGRPHQISLMGVPQEVNLGVVPGGSRSLNPIPEVPNISSSCGSPMWIQKVDPQSVVPEGVAPRVGPKAFPQCRSHKGVKQNSPERIS
jgi:hypothetical protein